MLQTHWARTHPNLSWCSGARAPRTGPSSASSRQIKPSLIRNIIRRNINRKIIFFVFPSLQGAPLGLFPRAARREHVAPVAPAVLLAAGGSFPAPRASWI